MQYAIRNHRRVQPEPNSCGLCPLCMGEVIAKCGRINVWHWAHKSRDDCDSWSEGESKWHLDWKYRFPRTWREVSIGCHRADIKSPQFVIELQSSSISAAEVHERECFYGNMVWVVDAREFCIEIRDRGRYVTFRWKHPRKTWWFADRELFFDLGDRLLRIHRIHPEIPCGGSGTYIKYNEFVHRFSKPRNGEWLCESCCRSIPLRQLTETGVTDFYQLDVDPGTFLCCECLQAKRESRTPDDVNLFDVFTPLATTA